MLKAVKKLMGLAQSNRSKSMDIKLTFMGEIDGELFKFEKKLYSLHEAVKYLKDLQGQLTKFEEIEDSIVNDKILKKYNRIFEMFEKDGKNLLLNKDNKIKNNLKLQTVIYEDNKNKFQFNDIDKDLKKYKNPFNINKIIKKARVKK